MIHWLMKKRRAMISLMLFLGLEPCLLVFFFLDFSFFSFLWSLVFLISSKTKTEHGTLHILIGSTVQFEKCLIDSGEIYINIFSCLWLIYFQQLFKITSTQLRCQKEQILLLLLLYNVFFPSLSPSLSLSLSLFLIVQKKQSTGWCII